MAVCASCGHDTPDSEARFCAACGKPLTPMAAAEVTSVIALGSSGDAEDTEGVEDIASPDPESYRAGDAALIERLEPGSAILVVKHGPSAGARFLLDADETTAGRHPLSDIFLDDITVSRRHAEFRRHADGFSVHDVGSLNGTYVNRSRVDEAALVSSDEVQIGKYRLVFLAAAPNAKDAG